MLKTICGITINDDIDWEHLDKAAAATVIMTMITFLFCTWLIVIL